MQTIEDQREKLHAAFAIQRSFLWILGGLWDFFYSGLAVTSKSRQINISLISMFRNAAQKWTRILDFNAIFWTDFLAFVFHFTEID